jgi:hypothetical protein
VLSLAHIAPRAAAPASPEWLAVAIAVALVLVIGARLVHGQLDRGRIRAYAAENGWEVLECRWSPYGPGWVGARQARIYAVRYRDREGRSHAAYLKTSMFGGVYLTEDRVEG